MTETAPCILRSRRNCSNDGAQRTDDGRAFNARAAVTGKARSPSVVRRVVGMTSVDSEALRRRRREPTCLSQVGVLSKHTDGFSAWRLSPNRPTLCYKEIQAFEIVVVCTESPKQCAVHRSSQRVVNLAPHLMDTYRNCTVRMLYQNMY